MIQPWHCHILLMGTIGFQMESLNIIQIEISNSFQFNTLNVLCVFMWKNKIVDQIVQKNANLKKQFEILLI
jgi:hypothetical protein